MGNSAKRRMKVANTPTEKGVVDLLEIEVDASDKGMNISGIIAEIERLTKERLKVEKQARKDRKRVAKSIESKRFRHCYIYREWVIVKSNGETRCYKHLCPVSVRP